MDPAHWERIQELFHAVADLPLAEQRPTLEALCGADSALVAEVLSLLEDDREGAVLLGRPLAELARAVVEREGATLPSQIGPYRVLSWLGEGGMAVVYLAERTDLQNHVAIKVLLDATLSPERRRRFFAEQKLLAGLVHPSIARLYDAGVLADGTPWFAMEYVDGEPITAYCDRQKASVEERLRLLRAGCEAVQFAHDHAVIHRDLKPSNLLVKADGTVRLLDFGIAKRLDLEDAVEATRTGLRLMTPAYASPEQLRGEPVTVQSDVYSLGVILFKLLTGRLPVDPAGKTSDELAAAVNATPPRPSTVALGKLAGKVRRNDLDMLCLKALHREPGRRYASAGALSRDIDRYLSGEPLEARPDALSYRLGRFAARNRRGVIAAAAMLALLMVAGALFSVRLASARNAAVAEADRRQRIEEFMLGLFQGGEDKRGVPSDLRVVTLLDQGVKQVRSLDQKPELQAGFENVLGKMLLNLGKLDQADSLLQAALETRKKTAGPQSADVVESLTQLSVLRSEQGRLDEGANRAREALAILERHREMNDAFAVNASIALGKVLRLQGKNDEATTLLQGLLRRKGHAPLDLESQARILSMLAAIQFDVSRYDEADESGRRSMALYEQVYGKVHPDIADRLAGLSDVAQNRGNFAEAERLRREALAMDVSWFGEQSAAVALDLRTLGNTLLSQGRLEESEASLAQAATIEEKLHGRNDWRYGSVLNELGGLALRRGNLTAAEARFTRTLEICQAVFGEKHVTVATSQMNLGSVYMLRKEWPKAESFVRRALATCAAADAMGTASCVVGEVKLGQVLHEEGRDTEALEAVLGGYRDLAKLKLQANPWFDKARSTLAAIYRKLGDTAEAAEYEPRR
jgi:eukaryotic-like serine/threonine-protein kinase